GPPGRSGRGRLVTAPAADGAGSAWPGAARGAGASSAAGLLLLLTFDVVDDLADRLHLLGLRVGDDDGQLLLALHEELGHVEGIDAEVLPRRVARDLLAALGVAQQREDLLLDFAHRRLRVRWLRAGRRPFQSAGHAAGRLRHASPVTAIVLKDGD